MHNNWKQKLYKYAETYLEKLVKSLWMYLFLAGFSLVEPKYAALRTTHCCCKIVASFRVLRIFILRVLVNVEREIF